MYSELLKSIENIVLTPLFSAVGYTNGFLVYSGMIEGSRSLWVMNLKDEAKVKIADNIVGVSDIPPNTEFLAYTKDIMRGKEQHRVFIYNIKSRETIPIESIPPMRIAGLAFDGENFAVSGATQQGIEIWRIKADGSSSEKLMNTDKLLFVTSVEKNIIVGQGMLKGNPRSIELFTFDMNTNEFRVLTPKEGSVNKDPRIKNGKILFVSDYKGDDTLTIYDLNTESFVEPELGGKDYKNYKITQIIAHDWMPNGNIWFSGFIDGRSKLFVDGKEIKTPAGMVYNLVDGDNNFYATWSSISKPTRILKINKHTLESEDFLGADVPKEIIENIGEVKTIKYQSSDGLEIPAIIIENKKVGKPGKTIIYIHGGPFAHVADNWNLLIASIVLSGYHVVAPNYRGSTGYGEKFRLLIIGDPGGKEYKDVVNAAKWARESGLASEVAIMGYSYGGYMTLYALGRAPNLWKVGVAGAPVVDWGEMYQLSDAMFKKFIELLFANKKELWEERSPITYAENVEVPVCIIQSQNDTRTPLQPVLRYLEKLMRNNKTFEAHIIPDMGHAIVKVEDAIKIVWPAIVFLKKYYS